jgi:hypothetical protein
VAGRQLDPLWLFKRNLAKRAAAGTYGIVPESGLCPNYPSTSTYSAVVLPSRGLSGIIFGV